LDGASLWGVGTGLLAFREAFTNQARGTITEPLEPSHLALLQQTAEIHDGFILGFPKGRELTDRADHARLSPEIIARIMPPAHNILAGLASASNFVELRTRKFLHVADASFLAHGWQAARIGHATYVIIRNSVIALGKFFVRYKYCLRGASWRACLGCVKFGRAYKASYSGILGPQRAGRIELCRTLP